MGASNQRAALCLEGLSGGLFSRRSACTSPSGTPLPLISHRRVERHEVCTQPGGRLLIVGDVHGCAEELRSLLKAESFDKGRDTLVLVGDLVNKGPSSGEVIAIARDNGAFCVRGNHEDELLEAWHGVGRYANGLGSYRQNAKGQVDAEAVRWVQELPFTLSFPWLKLVVVHAGLIPGVPLEKQKVKDMMWVRDVRPSDSDAGWEGLETPQEGSYSWAKVWSGPEHVVFGHDAKRKLQTHEFATGLDTGCCYGFQLTALVVNPDDASDRRFVHAQAGKVHSAPKDRSFREVPVTHTV